MALSRGERWGVAAAAAVLAILVAIGLVVFVAGRRASKLSDCRLNLARLSMAVHAGKVDDPSWDNQPVGSAFWISTDQWKYKPTVPITRRELQCPVLGKRGGVDYRGPVDSIRKMEVDAPIGADREGNHGENSGGNVILRNGHLIEAGPDDPVWIQARETTRD